MRFSCSNCNIKNDMNKIRNRLEKLIANSNQALYSKDIVKMSQLLDNFVYKCTFCSENLNPCTNNINNNKLILESLDNYTYLNDYHFIVSLYYYIIQGIKKNQLIFLSMNENLYNDIIKIAKRLKIPTKHLQFRSIKESILWNSQGGIKHLQEYVTYLPHEKNMGKYIGFRWISHPQYAIKNTSLDDFYNWEMNLINALDYPNSNTSLDFVYKKYTAQNEHNYIDEPIIDTSIELKSYDVDDNTFKGIEYKFK